MINWSTKEVDEEQQILIFHDSTTECEGRSTALQTNLHAAAAYCNMKMNQSIFSCSTCPLTFSMYIYAAGSVAKYPNNVTGHVIVTGEGIVDGTTAGKAAAENMAREYMRLSESFEGDV